MRHVQAELS
uniref:Family with sequence similarity 214 member B n=2 Tax=Myomorpha TaxID=1963758 RepID=A0A8C5K4N5_JACJA